MGQMDRSGTEDLGITARLMYGYILSNTSVLTAAESSYVLLAGLIPQDVRKIGHTLNLIDCIQHLSATIGQSAIEGAFEGRAQ